MDGEGLILAAGNGAKRKIELRAVSKVFRGQKSSAETLALDAVSLSIEDGEFVCLLGPSGCGKSTVLNLIAGFEKASKGEVLLDGSPVQRPGPDRGMVFQEPLLYPWLNVFDNITFGPRMDGRPAADYVPAAKRLIERVGLSGFEKHRSYELSGGMKQRTALARAWIGNPQVLLMDEPFAALDAQTRSMMQEQLVQLCEQSKVTVVFVTHDVEEAILLADRVLVMTGRPGRIKEDITVQLERPRSYERLIGSTDAAALKQHVFQIVREEALKTMEAGRSQ